VKNNLLEKIQNYQFAAMICAAVGLTAILTTISIFIYVSSGAINIDLSRPGYEKIRGETLADDSEAQFLPSGPIDEDVLSDINNRLENLQTKLNSMNNFSSDVISDEALYLAEGE
jgi:hypothetical protein